MKKIDKSFQKKMKETFLKSTNVHMSTIVQKMYVPEIKK